MVDYLEKLEGIYLPVKDLRFILNGFGMELLAIQGDTRFTYLGKNGKMYHIRDDRPEIGDMTGYDNFEKVFLDEGDGTVMISVNGERKSTYLLKENKVGREVFNILAGGKNEFR